jgi:integrase
MGRQEGCIYKSKNGRRWFARYRIAGKMVFCDLAPVNDAYRAKKDVQPLLDEILLPVNAGKVKPESTQTVAEFAEGHWLPWARENCKPSTVAGYETLWKTYLAPSLKQTSLRAFRTVDAACLFADIHRKHKIGRSTLQHCKSRLSGIFTLARNQGALDSPNPVEGAMIPKKAAAPSRTHAATPDEVMAILEILRKAEEWKARAAVALMFFAGLRPGEARGLCWEHYQNKRLRVTQSVWHKFTTDPKTIDAASPVPVIETLADILSHLRQQDGNPSTGPILRGPSGKPMILDNLSKRVVSPLLKSAGLEWHGWYSLRRGVVTTLAELTKDGMASKGLLRHTNLATTTRHYVKDVPENTLSAMNLLESLFNECSTTSVVRPN